MSNTAIFSCIRMSNDIDSLSDANDCFKSLAQLKVLIMDFNLLRTIS